MDLQPEAIMALTFTGFAAGLWCRTMFVSYTSIGRAAYFSRRASR